MSWDASQLFSRALTGLWACHHSLAWQSISRAPVSSYKGADAAGTLLSWPDFNGGIKNGNHCSYAIQSLQETDKVAAVVILRKKYLKLTNLLQGETVVAFLFLAGNPLKSRRGRSFPCLYPAWLAGNHTLQPIILTSSSCNATSVFIQLSASNFFYKAVYSYCFKMWVWVSAVLELAHKASVWWYFPNNVNTLLLWNQSWLEDLYHRKWQMLQTWFLPPLA